MMKILINIFLFFILASSSYANDNVFIAKDFSIVVPEEMTIDEKSNDEISLVFKGDEDLENGILSVISKPCSNITSFDTAWPKIRSANISGKQILFEKEDAFSGLKWKVLAVSGESANCIIQDVLYFSFDKNIQYMLHYHCSPENCEIMKVAFGKIIDSFKMQQDKEKSNN